MSDSGFDDWDLDGNPDFRERLSAMRRDLRERVLPTVRRMRWERVVVAIGLCAVPFCLFSGRASGSEHERVAVSEDFVGPRVRVGYSPITNAERKAAAEEEIRQDKIAKGEIDKAEQEVSPDPEPLRSADDDYQHEGDLDFTDANRDNLIARAVRGWKRPTWLSDVDWDAVKERLGATEDSEDDTMREQTFDDTPDESVAGYDDIVRLSFPDGVPFSYKLANGKTVTYDGTNKMSGDAAQCPDLDRTVLSDSHAVFVLNQEGDEGAVNVMTPDEIDESYNSFFFWDEVVPEERSGATMMCTVGATYLKEVRLDRLGHEIEAVREPQEEEPKDKKNFSISASLVGGKSIFSGDSVRVQVSSSSHRHMRVSVSGAGAVIKTNDDGGLAGIDVELRYRYHGKENTIEKTLETDEKSVFIDLLDYIDE